MRGWALLDTAVGDGPEMRTLMLHELGHIIGLDHVDTPTETMYPWVTALGDYGPGDREGLWWLGAYQGCVTLPSAAASNERQHDDIVVVERSSCTTGTRQRT